MKYTTILPLIALSLIQPAICAQETAAPAAQNQAAETTAELQQDPLITRGELPNGVKYIIRPTTEPQGRASVRLHVNTGSLDEQEHEKGISHLIEHLVFNGSRHFKRGELIPTMQQMGLGFGGDANAYTSLLETVYMLDLPNLNDETVDFAFTIMRDFADGATLEGSAIEHERGIVKSELYARDSASYRASIATLRHAAPGTRLPDYLPIGTEEVIMGAPHEVFRHYYDTHYVARNMTVIVTGDFKPETAVSWVEKYFGSMEDKKPADRIAPGIPGEPEADDIVIENPENALTSISVMVSTPWQAKADTAEQRMKDLPLELACAMLNQRFAHMAREADCPFQDADISKSDLFQTADLLGLNITAEPGKWKQAASKGIMELRRACLHGFSESELKKTAASTYAAYTRQINGWSTVNAASMADMIIDAISSNQQMTNPEEDKRVFEAGLNRILQNPELCREALAAAFDAAKARTLLTAAKLGDISGQDVRNIFDEVMQQEVSPLAEEATPDFAYETIGTPGSIEQQAVLEDLDITTLTLSNGVRVNLKPVSFSKGSISVNAHIDGGSLRLMHTPGLNTMAGRVMILGGLEAHPVTEIEKIMAGKNVGIHFGIGSDRFNVSGNTTAADFETQCKLLAALILHPGYRTDGEILLRRQLPAIYNRYETTPNGAYNLQAPKAMYGNDPRFTTPEQAQVAACTTEQVKAALEPWLREGAMEVSVVGDFKVEEVIPIIQRTFGAMPPRKRDFTPLSEAETAVNDVKWGQRTFLPYSTDLDKTIVAQVRPCGDGMDQHRNRRLAVLTSITRQKLFDGIRAQLGETYSPSVRLATNASLSNAATLTTLSAGVVGNRIKVNTAMDAILMELGQGKITQDDFLCALRPYVSNVQKNLNTVEYWNSALARLQSDSSQLPLIRDITEDVKSITLEEIQQLAREIFGPQDTTNYFFTMPADAVPQQEPAQEEKTEPVSASYTIISSQSTMADPAWASVAEALKKKYNGAELITLAELSESSITEALRSTRSRYAACVLQPQEVDRILVNNLHRAARNIDDDPWGDCIWGIITGHTAADAMRIACDSEPLVIKRLLGTTNVHHARFEHSCCITDWTGAPVLLQSGYQEPDTTTYPDNGVEDKLLGIFSGELSYQNPQFVVTSSHATQFNLEMPFGRGLIFSHGNRFHMLPASDFHHFGGALNKALAGDNTELSALAEKYDDVAPDGTTRVWVAAGNCLFGDAHNSPHSMCVTALSAYTCNQVVGYTVPSWYGAGGWGTLGTFMGNTAGTTLAEAWFLNNQFILHQTNQLNPKLLEVHFNEASFSPGAIIPQLMKARIQVKQNEARELLGLVHDRDVVAFYGDPAWRAQLDETHSQAPYSIIWHNAKNFTITANYDTKERCAVWFPTDETGRGATGCTAPDAIFTNDFILFPSLEMKKGETLTVEVK